MSKEKVLEIKVDPADRLVFPTTAHSEITTTAELDKKLGLLFKSTFADFYGLRPEYNFNTNRLTLAACFTHQAFNGGERVAFRPNNFKNGSDINGYERVSNFYLAINEGNKFHITEDAMDAIEPFIAFEARERSNGEVNWKANGLITEESENGTNNFLMDYNRKTFSVIHFIDPIAMIKEIYGTSVNVYVGNDDSGNPMIEEHEVDYDIHVLGIVPNQYETMQQVYSGITRAKLRLDIRQFDKEEMKKSAAAIGMVYNNNLGYDRPE